MDRISEFNLEQSDASEMFPYRSADVAASLVEFPCSKNIADGRCAAPGAASAGPTLDPTHIGPAACGKPLTARAPAECRVPTFAVGSSEILQRCEAATAIQPIRSPAKWSDANETLDEDFDELDWTVRDTELFGAGCRIRAVYLE